MSNVEIQPSDGKIITVSSKEIELMTPDQLEIWIANLPFEEEMKERLRELFGLKTSKIGQV